MHHVTSDDIDNIAHITITFDVTGTAELERTIASIEAIPGVDEVLQQASPAGHRHRDSPQSNPAVSTDGGRHGPVVETADNIQDRHVSEPPKYEPEDGCQHVAEQAAIHFQNRRNLRGKRLFLSF